MLDWQHKGIYAWDFPLAGLSEHPALHAAAAITAMRVSAHPVGLMQAVGEITAPQGHTDMRIPSISPTA
jgi:hypothetical protein